MSPGPPCKTMLHVAPSSAFRAACHIFVSAIYYVAVYTVIVGVSDGEKGKAVEWLLLRG